jgi:hypothetical protein
MLKGQFVLPVDTTCTVERSVRREEPIVTQRKVATKAEPKTANVQTKSRTV